MKEDVKKFLDSVKESDSDTFKVYVPSQKKEVDCKPLSFKQQKEIISTVAEGPTGAVKFQRILNDVILENLGSVLLSDKSAVIVALRKNAIGNPEIDEEEIDLDGVLKNFRKFNPKKTTSIKDKITASIEIPTIEKENKILYSTIESFRKNGENVGKNVSQIYTYEIVKYIKELGIGEVNIKFDEISVGEMLEIVDNLPLNFNKKIIDFIQDYKTQEAEILKVGDKEIDIDVSFFDS